MSDGADPDTKGSTHGFEAGERDPAEFLADILDDADAEDDDDNPFTEDDDIADALTEVILLDARKDTSRDDERRAVEGLFREAAGRGGDVQRQALSHADRSTSLSTRELQNIMSECRGRPREWWEYAVTLFERDDATVTEATNAVASAVLAEENYAHVRETGELYRYDPDAGFYRRKGESYIGELLNDRIPSYLNTRRRNNVVERVRDRSVVEQREFQPPAGTLCVANGTLDLDSRDLGEHSPTHRFRSSLQTAYDPDAECPEWRAFLRDVVPDDAARQTLQEFAGYCLDVSHHKRAKNLFVVGPTASGKSTFIETIQSLFGDPPATAALTPQQLAGRFDAAALDGAAINAKNDINSTKIEDSGRLKTIFAGETTKVERKYQDASFTTLPAKHLFSANWLPRVVGEDEALFRRVLIVEFPETIPRDERDLDLKDRLRDEELSGILNWALDGRDRLHDQGQFTRDRDGQATRLKWLSWRSAPLRFLFETCTITGDPDDYVERKSAYRAYKVWAAREGFDITTQQQMTSLWKTVPHVETGEVDDPEADGVFKGVVLVGEDAAAGYNPSPPSTEGY